MQRLVGTPILKYLGKLTTTSTSRAAEVQGVA